MTVRIDTIFAVDGDRTVINDTESDDTVSWDSGYTSAYSLDTDKDGYLYIERGTENYLRYVMTGNIKHWQEYCYPQWFDDIAYPKFTIVTVDGVSYINTVATDAGTEVTDTDYWSALEDFLGLEATESISGSVTLATETETLKGTGDDKVITSANLETLLVGLEMWCSTIKTGYLNEAGQLVSRTTYANLWSYVEENDLYVTDTAWLSLASSNGSVGVFSSGDGSTTFRLPRINDFIRGVGNSSRDVGDFNDSQNLSHTHTGSGTTSSNTHTHTGSGTTSSTSHTHSYSGTSNSAGAHTHTLTMTRYGQASGAAGLTYVPLTSTYKAIYTLSMPYTSCASAGSHTHTYSGTTGSNSHTHTYSFTTSSSTHTHTYSFTTGSTGDDEAQPKNISRYFIIKY